MVARPPRASPEKDFQAQLLLRRNPDFATGGLQENLAQWEWILAEVVMAKDLFAAIIYRIHRLSLAHGPI